MKSLAFHFLIGHTVYMKREKKESGKQSFRFISLIVYLGSNVINGLYKSMFLLDAIHMVVFFVVQNYFCSIFLYFSQLYPTKWFRI